GDSPAFMLAGDEPALPIARVAVGVVRGFAENGGGASLLIPPHDPVVRNVAPQQVAPVAEPHWTFGPAEAGSQTLDRRVERGLDAFEAWVERTDRRIGVACGRLPSHRRSGQWIKRRSRYRIHRLRSSANALSAPRAKRVASIDLDDLFLVQRGELFLGEAEQ